ncbi:MAG: condensation domain-containing protein [Methylocella sp.]
MTPAPQDEFAGLSVTRAPRTQSLPLSHAQLRLWFMYQMDPANPLHHFTVAVRITGPFDANAFEASLNAIVRRHESLRTVLSRRCTLNVVPVTVRSSRSNWCSTMSR